MIDYDHVGKPLGTLLNNSQSVLFAAVVADNDFIVGAGFLKKRIGIGNLLADCGFVIVGWYHQ